MKNTYWLLPLVTVALAAPPAMAQVAEPQQQPQQQQPQQQPEQRPADRDAAVDRQRADERRVDQRDERAAHDGVIRADRLIGEAVRDQRGERIGRINDLALNIEDDKIAYAVVTRGGVWGIGGEDVMVPWDQLQPDPAQRVVRMSEAQLQQARRIERGQAWPMGIGEGPVGTAGVAPQHRVLPMSNVVGMDVYNKQGERLGGIDDVVIQRDGKLSYAVVAYGGFLGMGDNHVAVPWDRFEFDAERQAVVLDVARDSFERAPRFEHRDRWPERADWPFGNRR
jgi:sporulation protein YlmC with PRC-barrel domain